MAIIPKNDDPNHLLNKQMITSEPRDYLGLSQVGHECHRYLQYYHYWAFTGQHDNRIQRLFDFGNMMEDEMIADLCHNLDIHVMSQQQEIVGVAGHWKGHVDGKAIYNDLDYTVEFKTHNDKYFKTLKKDKVEKGFPKHYDQATAYTGYLGYAGTVYLGYNKNDSEYYFEVIPFDQDRFDELKRKQLEVISSDVLLPRIGNGSPAWFQCKMCDAASVCFKRSKVHKSCRSCENVDIWNNGTWICTVGGPKEKLAAVVLTTEDQRAGCKFYELGVMFK